MYTRTEEITLVTLILILGIIIFAHFAGVNQNKSPDLFKQSPDFFRLNINRADWAELDLLPGIGPTWAKKIVRHRRSHGPFKNINDLKAVGLPDRTIKKLAGHVKF